MSKTTLFAQHAKLQVDHAVSNSYRAFSGDQSLLQAFDELIGAVRERSALMRHPAVVDGRVLQLEALHNLASFAPEWINPISGWSGASGSMRCVIASLARHLLARFDMPQFLSSVWFGSDGQYGRNKRRWYIEHASGRRFRDLELPMVMTRQMERLFLASPDHLTVEQAMRRAELKALGASLELIDSVLATRLGTELSHGEFWRTVMCFLIRFSDDLDLSMVGPIVDFLHAVRHERVEIQADNGVTFMAPPQPSFSMKGRTLQSVLRLVEGWHKSLGRSACAHLRWDGSRHLPVIFQDDPVDADTPPVLWEFVELTNGTELRREGAALRHCVASYAYLCVRGKSRIWSIRRRSSRGTVRSVATIEVDPRTNAIVQARGYQNRAPSGKAMRLLQAWAKRERLRMAV